MAAPATPAHSAQPSTSPAPASAGAQYPTPSSLPLEPAFPPSPAYPTFVHNGTPFVYIPVPVAFLPGLPHLTTRKRRRPNTPPPCVLCRLSGTSCVAAHPGDACQRCVAKQIECFDDAESADAPRRRLPPTHDGPGDPDSDPELDPNQPPAVWLPGYPQASPYHPSANSAKRERVIKACPDCHARKRKCTGVGGPNCGISGPRVAPTANGVVANARPSPRKGTPAGANGHTRGRESCAECRRSKRRCVHHEHDRDGPSAEIDGPEDARHEENDPPRSSRSPPQRWNGPSQYYPPPPPPPQFPYDHRMPYAPHLPPGQIIHPHDHAYAPPHPHGLHPPHARLPPAPDMRHPMPGPPGCKECRARGVPCACPETRAADDGAGSASSASSSAPIPPVVPATNGGPKGATPAPTPAAPPAGRKGRACLACRKLKMRCVAPNSNNANGNDSANPDAPDERCQRCERGGLECIYVDRKRRGPGTVFGVQPDGTPGSFENAFVPNGHNSGGNVSANGTPGSPRPPAKKLKREASPSHARRPTEDTLMQLVSPDDARRQRNGEDAARALEETFADDDDDSRSR